jgi:hypothetical protein
MDRYTETAEAATPSSPEEECTDPCFLLQSQSGRYRTTLNGLQDACSVVVARFSMHEMAHEALDEARLWFSDEDLVCMPGSIDNDARLNSADILHEHGCSLLTRVRDSGEASRAVDIMLGRGATRADVLSADCALQGWRARAVASSSKTPLSDP